MGGCEDSLAALVGVFLLNMTVGLLYIGLPEFKFLKDLYDVIVENIESHNYSETYERLIHGTGHQTITDGDFSDRHHYIQDWLVELPTDYKKRLPEKVQEHLKTQTQSQNRWKRVTWWIYKWLTMNGDRFLIWTIVVFSTIIVVYGRLWFSDVLNENFDHLSYLASFCIFIVGLNVILGYYLPRRVHTKLDESMGHVKNKLKEQEESSNVGDFVTSQRTSTKRVIGITRNLDKRKREHEDKYSTLRNWQLVSTHTNKDEAISRQNLIVQKYEAEKDEDEGGPKSAIWFVYRFDYGEE